MRVERVLGRWLPPDGHVELLHQGVVEIMVVRLPDVNVLWRFGVAVSSPRLWFVDWLDTDVGWWVELWVPAGMRNVPGSTVWSKWIEAPLLLGQ